MTYTIETYRVVNYISRSEKKELRKQQLSDNFLKNNNLTEKIQARRFTKKGFSIFVRLNTTEKYVKNTSLLNLL